MGITRRLFLIGAAAAAGGLAVGAYVVAQPHENPLPPTLPEGEASLNPYVVIARNGAVTIVVPRAEMGQGVQTALAALVAEELDVPWGVIRVVHGPASPAYANHAMLAAAAPVSPLTQGRIADTLRGVYGFAGRALGLQVTGGSTSVVDAFDTMRMAGAAARAMLVEAAAARLGVPAGELRTQDGSVVAPDGRSLGYGEVAAGAAALTVPSSVALKEPRSWRYIGKPMPRLDTPAKVTGAAVYAGDVRLPDMLFATLRMNPRPGGRLLAYDAEAARRLPGVEKVVELRGPYGEGLGVIARDTFTAMRAAELIRPEWGRAPYPANSNALRTEIAYLLDKGDAASFLAEGDARAALAADDGSGGPVLEAAYEVPFLAQATMEPMTAAARLLYGRLEVWTGTQAPTLVRSKLADALGLAPENVEVHTTLMGGGFGRRAEFDAPLYAALLARETSGRPVSLTYPRTEDLRHGAFRPAALARLRGRLGRDGSVRALHFRVAAPSILRSVLHRMLPAMPMLGSDKLVAEGAADQPYAIPHHSVEGVGIDLGLPVGFWRSVGYSHNTFFLETFLDELARANGIDPLDLRLKLASAHAPAVGVLSKAAEMSGWGREKRPGTGRGLAFALSFGTWVAQIVEVEETKQGLRVARVWCAADAGTILNPRDLAIQMQSGIVYGLSAAIRQAITFGDEGVLEASFEDYPVLRMADTPPIEVALLSSAPRMGGGGEPGVPPIAPALGNAIFDLTGERLREMPFARKVRFAG